MFISASSMIHAYIFLGVLPERNMSLGLFPRLVSTETFQVDHVLGSEPVSRYIQASCMKSLRHLPDLQRKAVTYQACEYLGTKLNCLTAKNGRRVAIRFFVLLVSGV
jgi:hypothetical protein